MDRDYIVLSCFNACSQYIHELGYLVLLLPVYLEYSNMYSTACMVPHGEVDIIGMQWIDNDLVVLIP